MGVMRDVALGGSVCVDSTFALLAAALPSDDSDRAGGAFEDSVRTAEGSRDAAAQLVIEDRIANVCRSLHAARPLLQVNGCVTPGHALI
jgi:hypothetical protein